MRIIILACAFSLFQNVSWGQKFQNKVSVEPRAGLTFSKLMNSNSPFGYGNHEDKTLNSFSFGVLIQYNLTDRFSILSGYSNETKGSTKSYELITTQNEGAEFKRTSVTVRNKYNSFPLFGRVKFQKNKIGLFGDLGIYLSSISNSSIKGYEVAFVNSISGDATFINISDKQYTNNLDYGILIGGGITYALNTRLTFQFNPQVSVGLRKLDKYNSNDRVVLVGSSGFIIQEKDYFGLSSNSKNLMLALNIGMSYSFNK